MAGVSRTAGLVGASTAPGGEKVEAGGGESKVAEMIAASYIITRGDPVLSPYITSASVTSDDQSLYPEKPWSLYIDTKRQDNCTFWLILL